MKLVIELTNGRQDSCGDCERVSEMIAGFKRTDLEKEFDRRMPHFWYEE